VLVSGERSNGVRFAGLLSGCDLLSPKLLLGKRKILSCQAPLPKGRFLYNRIFRSNTGVPDGSEGAATNIAAAVPSPALAVPASLHASLMARLDRLGAAKEVAQIGAAIGREFSHALLTAVMRKPEAELGSALDRLAVPDALIPRSRLSRKTPPRTATL
jgi:hypothetical protein